MPGQRKLNTEEQKAMMESIASFGYSVKVVKYRIFCLAPGDNTIFVIRKLKRDGFWELNQVDRFMWMRYGAMGYPLYTYITTGDLLEFLYCHAAAEEGIRQGLVLTQRDAFRQENFEDALTRLNKRVKQMYLEADKRYAKRAPSQNASERTKKTLYTKKRHVQDALDGATNEHCWARRKMIAVIDKNKGKRGTKNETTVQQ